jgi:hypothetical protein
MANHRPVRPEAGHDLVGDHQMPYLSHSARTALHVAVGGIRMPLVPVTVSG